MQLLDHAVVLPNVVAVESNALQPQHFGHGVGQTVSLWGETRWMEEGQTVSHHIVFVLCRYTLEQTNCFSLLGITSVQRSRDFPTHLSLSHLHLLPIKYDRSLARSRIDLVEAITRYTNKPINSGVVSLRISLCVL